jgi:hypothetical protein
MAIKTFTTGEVLTASDTNTYLNNGGLVLITSGITVSSAGGTAATVANGEVTVGTSNTSVTVSSAFSSTYDNYVVIWQGGTMSADTALKFKLGSTSNNCYGAFIHTPNYLGATVANVGDNNTAFFTYAGGGNSTGATAYLYLAGPNKATRTYITSGLINYSTIFGTYTGAHYANDQHTGFTFEPFSGTMTGGKIRVYGYRQV